MTSDFPCVNVHTRKEWRDIFKALKKKKKNYQPIILYPKKTFSKEECEMQAFSDTHKLKNFLTSRHSLKKMSKEVL